MAHDGWTVAERMRVQTITQENPHYPLILHKHLGEDAPSDLHAIGHLDLLARPTLAFFCSRKCPGRLILRSIDLANELADSGTTVIGGFHTPVERQFLRTVLRGRASAIVCPARSLARMRIPSELRRSFEEERLLFLSTFTGVIHRPTKETSHVRNRLVVALADAVLIAHAEPGGGTERVSRIAEQMGKRVVPLNADDPTEYSWRI